MGWFDFLFLGPINRRLDNIMATLADVQAQLDTANARLDGIQGDILSLKQQIADLSNGATPEQVQALLDSATALASKAGAIDDQTP